MFGVIADPVVVVGVVEDGMSAVEGFLVDVGAELGAGGMAGGGRAARGAKIIVVVAGPVSLLFADAALVTMTDGHFTSVQWSNQSSLLRMKVFSTNRGSVCVRKG